MQRLLLLTAVCVGLACASGHAVRRDPGQTGGVPVGDEFSLLCWNIGYGALAAEADFIADGGTHLIALDKEQVAANAGQIVAVVKEQACDFILIQEMSTGTLLNHLTDIYAQFRAALPAYYASYTSKVDSPLFCLPNNVGQAVFSRAAPVAAERLELGQEGGFFSPVQRHHLLALRFTLPGSEAGASLVLGNLHLSAFDPKAAGRYEQLSALKVFMDEVRAAGDFAVIGGDGNLEVTWPGRIFDTAQKYLFWIHPMPATFPGTGWQRAFPAGVPTVRTLERAYRKEHNYTTVIDGFIATDNIEVLEVQTLDLDFRYSDHQPVLLKIRLKAGIERD